MSYFFKVANVIYFKVIIDNWLKTYDTVIDHVLTVFHTDEYLLYFSIGLRSEPLINFILGASYQQLTLLNSLLLVLLIFSLLLRLSYRYSSFRMSLSVFSLNMPLVLRIVVVLIHNKFDAYEEYYTSD